MATASKRTVKCLYCGKQFTILPDKENIDWVKPRSNRYAHKQCADNMANGAPIQIDEAHKESIELQQLKDYINNLYNENVNWPLVIKQIMDYKSEYNYTYKGMLKSLIHFYEIEKHSLDPSVVKGVGIIPFHYKIAHDYYLDIIKAQQINNGKNPNILNQTKEIIIKSPKREIKTKLFDLGVEEE